MCEDTDFYEIYSMIRTKITKTFQNTEQSNLKHTIQIYNKEAKDKWACVSTMSTSYNHKVYRFSKTKGK